jgi:Subtilase family
MIAGIESINLVPDEILLTGAKVVMQTAEPVDRDRVERAVGVRGLPGTLQVSRDRKRVTWTPSDAAVPGLYEFAVDELTSGDKRVSTGGRIRFGLVRTAARVPANVVVESMTRVRVDRWQVQRLPLFDDRPQGKFVELMKTSDRKTGKPRTLAFDASGERVDLDAMMADILSARVKRFGKLDEDLDRVLRQASDDEKVSVAIWAQADDVLDPGDKSPEAADDSRAKSVGDRVGAAVREATGALREDLSKSGIDARADELAPVVYARLDKTAIRRLQENPRIAGIFRFDPRGFDDLDDSIAISNSDDVHSLGARGRGIRVAVWERGPDTTTNLAIAGTFDASGAMSTHSRLVHGVIRNTQANSPNGHAPGCTLFSANSYDLDALRWAVGDEQCTVINQSFHRDDEQTSSGLSFDDIYKDWVIMRPPYPTIVQAAGNSDDNDEYVNHKGFNSLAVANHNDDASAISSTSVFRNPASSHGDRELPEIGANGTGVAAVATSDSGTSFASPAVAGIAALLQGENTLLRSWPEGCRAILLAGATRNVSDATWWRDVSSSVDAADGSGAVNALESYRIVQERRSRNSAATRRGWDIGVLDDDDFDRVGDSDFTYRVLIPDWILGPRHVKVALAWDSKVKEFSLFGITIPIASALEQDLDLKVYDSNGSLVAQSQSWDNSYEIAEFDARRGEEYTIRIRRYSGTGWTWYGIAWTVTGGIRDLLDLGDVIFEQPITELLEDND